MRLLAFIAALTAATPAFAQELGAAPIVAAERAFAADFPAMGLAGSFSKWGRPDGIIIAEGQARTVEQLFADAPKTRQPNEPLIKWWPTFAGVARSGEMGFTTGPARRDQEGYGHYFTIWTRQADATWRWVYDGGSNASPEGQPGPETEPRLLPVSAVGAVSAAEAFEEVRAAETALATGARTNQKASHLAVLAEEGRLYVAPLPPAEGAEAFATALDGWPETFEFGATEGGGASEGGDMAWTYGPASWMREGVSRRGHYMRLWQKRSDGWRLVMAQLIPAPVAAPSPAGG